MHVANLTPLLFKAVFVTDKTKPLKKPSFYTAHIEKAILSSPGILP
jgi:hypothetical protein